MRFGEACFGLSGALFCGFGWQADCGDGRRIPGRYGLSVGCRVGDAGCGSCAPSGGVSALMGDVGQRRADGFRRWPE